jgi:phospholipid/cholesterol/gamma-HCH transport system substrate-binding protein
MNRSTDIEVKVGIFVALGVGLIMLTILMLGGGQEIFSRGTNFHAKFQQIEGLVEGATVKIAGVRVGQVTNIKFEKDSGLVDVTFSVTKKFKDAVRKDAVVAIQTQGVLGDRYLVLGTGSSDAPSAEPGAELRGEPPKELKDYLNNADVVLDNLKSSLSHMENILGSFRKENRAETFFKNISSFSVNASDGTRGMRESMQSLRSIFNKIDRGEGTLGALVNDPSLYDDLKALLGGANRNKVLKYFIRKSVEESKEAQKEAEEEAQKATRKN